MCVYQNYNGTSTRRRELVRNNENYFDDSRRGVDVPALPVVINYDIPSSPSDFIHRVGRTGRMKVCAFTRKDREEERHISTWIRAEKERVKERGRRRERERESLSFFLTYCFSSRRKRFLTEQKEGLGISFIAKLPQVER